MITLVSTTSAPSRLPHGETPTHYYSLIGSANAQACTPFLQQNSRRKRRSILVYQHILPWWCPISLLSTNGPQCCTYLAPAMYRLLDMRKIATSNYYHIGYGGVERVNHTMT